jgi:hypothetical protein
MAVSLIAFGLAQTRNIFSPARWTLELLWKALLGVGLLAATIRTIWLLVTDTLLVFPYVMSISIGYVWVITLCVILASSFWWANRVGVVAPVSIMFRASLVGLLYVMVLGVVAFYPDVTKDLWLGFSAPTAKDIASEELGTSLLATILGPLFGWTLNLLYPRLAVQSHLFAKRVTSSLDRLFYRATQRGKMVMLTLNDGKVYCGYIDWIPGNPNASDAFLEVQPVFSGYRENEGKKVQLPISYAPFYKKLPSSEWVQFRKIIPIANIAAAGEFDPAHFDAFAQQGKVDAPGLTASAAAPSEASQASKMEDVPKGPLAALVTLGALLWVLFRADRDIRG